MTSFITGAINIGTYSNSFNNFLKITAENDAEPQIFVSYDNGGDPIVRFTNIDIIYDSEIGNFDHKLIDSVRIKCIDNDKIYTYAPWQPQDVDWMHSFRTDTVNNGELLIWSPAVSEMLISVFKEANDVDLMFHQGNSAIRFRYSLIGFTRLFNSL